MNRTRDRHAPLCLQKCDPLAERHTRFCISQSSEVFPDDFHCVDRPHGYCPMPDGRCEFCRHPLSAAVHDPDNITPPLRP
ncbi:MAG: hypothetical protein JWL83_60 [Actinomycetia bacterium]|nr:hypothetical protein [Actinomycetes bacterium]